MKSMWKYGCWLVLAGLMIPQALLAQDASQTTTAPPQWVEMTDSVGHVIGLREDQQKGWKERNDKWNKEYEALSKGEEDEPTYIKLHNAREFDLRGFLTGGQYDKWKVLNLRSVRLFGTDNPPGTNMPPD